MKVHLHIEEQQQDIEVHIYTPELNEQVEQIMQKLKAPKTGNLIGYLDLDIYLLKIEDIFSVFTEDTKVFLQTDEHEYECKSKLYELEARYDNELIRINKSMLVNLTKIASIQSKLLGHPQLILTNGVSVKVSRKYFTLLKAKIGLGSDRE